MNIIYLSENEKRLLLHLYNNGNNVNNLKMDKHVISACAKRLKDIGFIVPYMSYDGLYYAKITDLGKVYIEDNPTLENPVEDNDIKKLQLDELRHNKTIRPIKSIIMWRSLIIAIVFFVGLIVWVILKLL